MEYTTLGKTGLKVSRLGFGGIPIQRIDEEGTGRLVDRMIEAGINYIDTARAYTVSEEYLGKALKGRRERFILATKCRAESREQFAAGIDTSLKMLQTDYIDLYQFHNPSVADFEALIAPGGALEAMKEAKEAGKIRHIGITAHSLEVFRRALETDWVETIMFPYNIVESQGMELIAACQEKNIGFIDMKPMAGGAIEDKNLALRYVLSNPAVTVAIPGMAAEEELEQNIAASSNTAPLTEEELKACEQVRAVLGNDFCRRCNYCAPCTAGISIPNVFLFAGYLERYGLADWAKQRYNALEVKADACVECGECESRCPYHLPIREKMKKIAGEFSQAL